MAKAKTLKEKLRGAAILKMSFRLRDAEGSAAFRGVYPGVLRDLGLTDEEVEAFIAANRDDVRRAAAGGRDDEPA